MDLFRSFQPKRRKLVVSTRRKINVLAALNSGSRECLCHIGEKVSGSDYQNAFDPGEICLIHPLIKGSIESSDDIIGLIDEMVLSHSSLCSILISGKSDISNALKILLASLDTYVSYSVFISLELRNFQKLSETNSDVYIDFDLLQEPMTHISRYKSLFQNLYRAAPDEAFCSILKAIEITSKKVQNALLLKKNALRTLQIQRFLFKREPKILSPGRMVLKEGILCKVSSNGSCLKERVFFLFNDILLCCKVLSKTSDWHEKNSLLFQALFPLNMCLVSFVMGSTKQGALFKVTCGTMSYLLTSKIPGEAQTWFHELETAVRACQKPFVKMKPKLKRQKNMSLKHMQKISPLFKKPVKSDPQKEPEDETTNPSELLCKKPSHGSIFKLFKN